MRLGLGLDPGLDRRGIVVGELGEWDGGADDSLQAWGSFLVASGDLSTGMIFIDWHVESRMLVCYMVH